MLSGVAHGSFIDDTPTPNEEFLPTSNPNESVARPGSAAEGKMDLVTVLLHEYGHVLGVEHSADAHDFMAATLPPGLRRTLSADQQVALMRLTGAFPTPDSPSEPYAPTDPGVPLSFTRLTGLARGSRLRGIEGAAGTEDALVQYDIAAHPRFDPAFTRGAGWDTTGDVRFGDSSATLSESAESQTRLNQVFVLGEHERFLSFTVTGSWLGDQETGPDDAFEVALIDANTGRSLLRPTGLSRSDAIVNRQTDGSEYLAKGVSVTVNADGSRFYALDLEAAVQPVAAGSVLNLSFDLIGFGRGAEARNSRVTIRDLHLGDRPPPPRAVDDAATTLEDTALRIDVLANDQDIDRPADQPPFAALLVDAPAHGQVAVNPDGSFDYTPEENWSGEDRFTYLLDNGLAHSDLATVRVGVAPVADTPTLFLGSVPAAKREIFRATWESVGNPNRFSTQVRQGALEGWQAVGQRIGSNGIGAAFAVWSSGDVLPNTRGTPLIVSATANPDRNWLELDNSPNGSVSAIERPLDTIAGATYTLSLDASGWPGAGEGDTSLRVLVDGKEIAHEKMASRPDALLWQTRTFSFVGSGDRQTIRIASETSRHNVWIGTMLDNLTLTETLPAQTGYEDTSVDLPTIHAALQDGDGSELLSVRIADIPAGATLIGGDGGQRFTASEDNRTAEVSDWNLEKLSIMPSPDYHGRFVLHVVATATEQANRQQASSIANVEVQVLPVNDAPIARDASFTMREGEHLVIDFSPLVADVDADALHFDVADPAHGVLSRNLDGTWTYEPNHRYSGDDSFAYTVSDGLLTATAKIRLTVTPVNHRPEWTSTPPASFELRDAGDGGIFAVAGVPGQLQTVIFDQLAGGNNGRDEFGLYRADDAEGRIGQLKPGDPGYAAAALMGERVVVLSGSGPNGGTRTAVPLPAGEYIGFYRILDGSTAAWRSHNPLNIVGRGPLAVFSVPAADSNRGNELRADADDGGLLRLTWESSRNASGGETERQSIRIGGLSTAPQPFRYQARARDEDGDPPTYRLLEGPTRASIDTVTGLLTWDGPQAGSYFFRIEVDDGNGGSVEQSFTVRFAGRRAQGENGGRSGTTTPRSLPTALGATIDWNGKAPSCFTGARFTPRGWLGDFLGAPSGTTSALDSPALRIRIER